MGNSQPAQFKTATIATSPTCVQAESGEAVTDEATIANILNKHFSETGANLCKALGDYQQSSVQSFLPPLEFDSPLKFELYPVHTHTVLDLINTINIKKAEGLDEISPKLLKIGAE